MTSRAQSDIALAVDAPAAALAARGAPKTVEEAARPRRAAVVVCHGMGQQVPFETIDSVARQIAELARREDAKQQPDVQVEQVATADGTFLPRANLTLTSASGAPIVTHFYEAYWAPLVEGKITLRDTLAFLFGAGWRGLKFGVRDGVFDRYMFGGRQEFEIPPRTIVELFFAFCAIILLATMYVGWLLLTAAIAASVIALSWPRPGNLAAIIGFDAGLLVALSVISVAGFLLSRVVGSSHRVESARSLEREVLKAPAWKRVGSLLLALLAAVIAGYAAYRIAVGLPLFLLGRPSLFAAASIVGLLIGVGLYGVRWFLIEFPGDVAVYVSAYKVSRFQETRVAIQTACRKVARFVYQLGDTRHGAAAAAESPYDDILIVGHSLGSVVAYDTLNDAINRDIHENGWSDGSAKTAYHVIERTKLLLTFGSPLDKTAFIFRTQENHERFEIREALAATVQPLILAPDYEYRPRHWINVWSRWDWVSGRLDYYDTPDANPAFSPDTKSVINVRAATSWRPDLAHTGYWTQPLVRGVIYATLTGTLPNDVRAAVADTEDAERLCELFSSDGDDVEHPHRS